jgi:hypothetical protein
MIPAVNTNTAAATPAFALITLLLALGMIWAYQNVAYDHAQ